MQSEPILEIVEEFISRHQRGERPTIEEYCDRHPQYADEIRDLFPALKLMEDLQPAADDTAAGSKLGDSCPDRIGDYHIIAEIGRGGMGVVYEAQQQSLGRRVALKVLPHSPHFGDSARIRFQREARAAAQMHHTNIVPVFEVGQEDGLFFYAMQLIQGQSLDHVIEELAGLGTGSKAEKLGAGSSSSSEKQSTAVPSEMSAATISGGLDGSSGGGRRRYYRSAVRIALQTAEALAYAHARGVIHRDIKPSNLILDADSVVWVTDFGLAKTDDEGMTQTGDFLGTLRYMSPERFKGACDERADVYALGLTLYELLVLRPAFQGTDRLRLIEAISKADPPKPRSIDRRIPQDLETIVLKAIEKEPQARYSSAKELAKDLQRFLDDVPIRARRASIGERLVRWSRRNKALAGALTGAIALALVLAVVSTGAWLRQSQLTEVAEQRGDELQRNLYYSEMNVAGQSASTRFGVPTIRRQLERWKPDNVGIDLRGWEWYYLYAMSHRERLATPKQDVWTWSVDCSPTTEEFVHCVNGWGIQVRSAETGEVVREKFLGSARYADWSPDGSKIAVAGFKANVNICDATTLEVLLEIGGERSQEVFCAKWSPDGTRIATCRRPIADEASPVRIWDANTGKLAQELHSPDQHAVNVSWSPDGTRLICSGHLRVWDTTSGEELYRMEEYINTSCWSPDGASIVIGHDRIEVKKLDSGETTHLMKTDTNLHIRSMGWRPGTRQLACGHADGTITLWDTDAKAKLRTLHGHSSEISDLEWNDAGTQLVSNGMHNTVRVWDVDGHDESQVIPIYSDSIDWSQDGSWMVGAGRWSSRVAIWDSCTSDIQEVLDDGNQIISVDISPDDQRIAIAGRFGLRVWNKTTKQLESEDKSLWHGDVAWDRHGERLASIDEFEPLLMLWKLDPFVRQDIEAEEIPRKIRWSPDDQRLAISSRTGGVTVRDASGELVWQRTREKPSYAICWKPDGTQLASSEIGAILIWDAETGAIVRTLDALSEDFGSLDWSPDGTRLASSSSSSVAIWDPVTGHVTTKLPGGGASRVRWSPDGRRLAAGRGPQGIHIWDASRGYEAAARD